MMKKNLILVGRVSYAVIATMAVGLPGAVYAQTASPAPTQPAEPAAAPAPQANNGDIVVTARKRDEKLQDVPISITAFTGATLQKLGVRDFAGLSLSNPNVKIESMQGGGGALGSSVSIRGNIQSATNLLPDPAVGTYMDGHIISRTYGTAGLVTDVVSVQTLKGPQGTLFGRNTTGGAVLVQTVDPSLDRVTGYAQIEGGEIGTFNAGAAVNVPLGDKLAFRGVYQHNSRGDYVNYSDGTRLGRDGSDVFRGKLLLEPTDTMKAIFMGEYTKQTNHQAIEPVTHPNDVITDDVPITNIVGGGARPIDPRTNDEASRYTGTFFTLQVTQEIGNGTLKFLAGRRDYHIHVLQSLPPALGYTRQDKPDNDDTSAELQYSGKVFDGRIDVAGGLFYFQDHLSEDLQTSFYSGVSQGTNKVKAHGESESAYLQATGHITDKLNLTGGLRYTHDKKSAIGAISNFSATDSGEPAAALANPRATWSGGGNRVNYLVSLDYSPIKGVMFYASHATGYRAAGANVTRVSTVRTDPAFLQLANFKPESIKNYEGGIKSEFWDRHIRLNADYFYQDYRDYQYGSTDPVLLVRRTFNSNARIKGVEVDAALRLDTGTTISGTYGLADGKVKDAASAANGAALPLIPKQTWSVTLEQSLRVHGDDTLNFLANFSWRSKFSTTIADSTTAIDEEGTTRIDKLGLLNLSATYTHGPIEFSINASNVTNRKYFVYETVVGSALNFGGVGVPRLVSARAKFNF